MQIYFCDLLEPKTGNKYIFVILVNLFLKFKHNET